MDFAERADGTWIVVETGDGQVSGLAAAQDSVIYYQVLADALERRDADGDRACASGIRTWCNTTPRLPRAASRHKATLPHLCRSFCFDET